MEDQGIIRGSLITKEKRQELFVSVSGKNSMKPENYQRNTIIKLTKINCSKTNTRINLISGILENVSRPNLLENGFEYSENFDGLQIIETNDKKVKIYVNLKCVCGNGGAQTRALRETYHFINGQILVFKKLGEISLDNEDIYFANILDGDYSHSCMSKLKFSLSKENSNIKSKIYIGDLKNYFSWFNQVNS